MITTHEAFGKYERVVDRAYLEQIRLEAKQFSTKRLSHALGSVGREIGVIAQHAISTAPPRASCPACLRHSTTRCPRRAPSPPACRQRKCIRSAGCRRRRSRPESLPPSRTSAACCPAWKRGVRISPGELFVDKWGNGERLLGLQSPMNRRRFLSSWHRTASCRTPTINAFSSDVSARCSN